MHKIFVGPMGVISEVRNSRRKKYTKVSRKQFGANGFGVFLAFNSH